VCVARRRSFRWAGLSLIATAAARYMLFLTGHFETLADELAEQDAWYGFYCWKCFMVVSNDE
jgi:hypothetical protein